MEENHPPAWQAAITNSDDLRAALAGELTKLDTPKQISTVTAVIMARLTGESYDTDAFWQRPDTCARSTWNKWKTQERFNAVLDSALTIAQGWQSAEAAAAIERASTMLQLSAPQFAQGVITLASGRDESGRRVRHSDRLRASLAGLDRASSKTANKGQLEVRGLDEALARIFGDEEEADGADEQQP